MLGNPSADMDSVVGSFVMSWLFGELKATGDLLYSPVINCKRQELPMRIEIMRHFEQFGMDADFIQKTAFFSEDLSQEAELEAEEGKSV